MNHLRHDNFVLSIYPTSRGFGFVLFESSESPFDWGVKEIREKHANKRTIKKVKDIIERYQPEALILEDADKRKTKRSKRIMKLYRELIQTAENLEIAVYRYPWVDVLKAFTESGIRTKRELAEVIAIHIPAFAHRIPRARKPWTSEDPRQSLFDAAALGIFHYQATLPEDAA